VPRRYAPGPEPLSTAFLLVERLKSDGTPVRAVKWRSADGERLRRRLGWTAWVEPDGRGGCRPRPGRPSAGALTEFQARRRMPDLIRAVEDERRPRPALEPAPQPDATFRALAHEWLEHVESVLGAKPSTLRDYRSMLSEPGAAYRRGTGRAVGRIMAALGDIPATEVTTADIEALLTAHAKEGVGARSVNKHRQVVSAIAEARRLVEAVG
jgi:hypothetical protein